MLVVFAKMCVILYGKIALLFTVIVYAHLGPCLDSLLVSSHCPMFRQALWETFQVAVVKYQWQEGVSFV